MSQNQSKSEFIHNDPFQAIEQNAPEIFDSGKPNKNFYKKKISFFFILCSLFFILYVFFHFSF